MPTDNMRKARRRMKRRKLIDARRLIEAKFGEPINDYQKGWNAALQAAYDVEGSAKYDVK